MRTGYVDPDTLIWLFWACFYFSIGALVVQFLFGWARARRTGEMTEPKHTAILNPALSGLGGVLVSAALWYSGAMHWAFGIGITAALVLSTLGLLRTAQRLSDLGKARRAARGD